jgi:hypothetical protein
MPAIRMIRVCLEDSPIKVLGLTKLSPLMHIQRQFKEQFDMPD